MNYNSSKTVPFVIQEISHGFQEAQGLMKLGKERLELEFEVKDAILGVIKSGVKDVAIPFSDLKSITYKKGWFGGKVILEGTSMKVFDDLPGTELATSTLIIRRKHRKEAENLISQARMLLSEYKLDQFEKDS